ncbi:hypothetical protein [Paenibacillus illinoisensis]|uniref:Uncharacterized protein n=1 Tax=Paenibacillus illinoisensis TaxID=59845 RepID=A0A2W0CDM1_9BACL|nr:hypothetical protein [Paenibacillus illinoisensis]PYY28192.1 hypothetical protein PIL02S_03338 [Paenibacillus illinoisensis]
MANWIKGEEVEFQENHSPMLIVGAYDNGTYELTLEGGWEDSASVIMTREEIQRVIEAFQKVI